MREVLSNMFMKLYELLIKKFVIEPIECIRKCGEIDNLRLENENLRKEVRELKNEVEKLRGNYEIYLPLPYKDLLDLVNEYFIDISKKFKNRIIRAFRSRQNDNPDKGSVVHRHYRMFKLVYDEILKHVNNPSPRLRVKKYKNKDFTLLEKIFSDLKSLYDNEYKRGKSISRNLNDINMLIDTLLKLFNGYITEIYG